uniref:2'-5' RNA ligase family protein n=1 Tax=Streptomyces polyasparticus TaxID=2767826 RepID=UPI00280C063E|nr:2'-5' RNA ligase family protein [Streptomyces polyasparticus]
MSSGWAHALGETALTILLPEADPLIREDFPAHVSVLFPFLHQDRIDASVRDRLGELLRGHEPFDLTFAEFGRYPGVLYLDPWPAGPVRALTKSVVAAWPECAPYRGIFGEDGLRPHLTLANSLGPEATADAYDALEAELAPLLPLTCTIRHVSLVTWDGTAFRETERFTLGV